MRRIGLSRAPIFVQVLALVAFSLIAAHGINLAVVLLLPDPPPQGYSIPEAARALKGETVRTSQGQTLRARAQEGPPAFGAPGGHRAHDGHDPLGPLLTGLLARELGVADAHVRVEAAPSLTVRHTISNVEMHRREGAGGDRREVQTRMFVTVDPIPGPPRDMVLRMRGAGGGLMFPPFAAAYQREDGQWMVLERSRPLLTPWQVRTLLWLGLSALVLTPLAWLMARRLARPIHSFAEAAARLGGDPNAPPLAVDGPEEVRAAAAAFNDMQDKLRRYVEERTAMVAAIAHDLRTPLTRMRFRIENAPDEVRDKVVADIEQMDAMVSQALTFVRGDTGTGQRVQLDLAALLQSVADDMAEMGADVAFTGKRLVLQADPIGLRRLSANLIENAVKFGGRARIALTEEDGMAVIRVEDDGPGLAPEEIERVFEPFHRADPSRAPATGGFGLGLSVARSIARAHGGEVSLANGAMGGLVATVRLPA